MTNTTTAAASTETMTPAVRTPLYGHTSRETAYIIADYPYGRSLRCQRLVWIESHPKKGFRFMAQTQDPRNGRWNAIKASTYALIAACMYLDHENHVHHDVVTEYSSADEILTFCQTFPGCDTSTLKVWISKKIRFYSARIDGSLVMEVNGSAVSVSDRDQMRYAKDVETLKAAYALLPLPTRARGLLGPRQSKARPEASWDGLRPLKGPDNHGCWYAWGAAHGRLLQRS